MNEINSIDLIDLKKRTAHLILCLALIASGFSVRAIAAELNHAESDKIEFLKQQILQSECQFERNGKTYSAETALKHISKKQDFYKKKINSAQDFINYTATKSHLTGKPYYLVCEEQQKKSLSHWLNNKLINFVNRW